MSAYLYRVDLTEAVGGKPLPCISALKLPFGPPAKLQYDGAGAPDDVYVITAGGLGSIGIASADLTGNVITFNFSKPGVCPGATAGAGTTSFFFGLASTKPAKPVTGQVQLNGGNWVDVAARAPNL